jgi:hypothetical protein
VEHIGLEPMTFCMPCRRATSCANAPYSTVMSAVFSTLATPTRYTVGGGAGKFNSSFGTSA